jgi:hypothetical protein
VTSGALMRDTVSSPKASASAIAWQAKAYF